MQLLRELDFVGLFLFSAGCILFLLGVNWGERQHLWKTAYVIAPMVLGVLCLIALGFWEAYADLKYPVMPLDSLRSGEGKFPYEILLEGASLMSFRFTMMLVVCFVGGMLYYAMNVL
jgi:hypothetical protein